MTAASVPVRAERVEAPYEGRTALLVHGGAWAIPDDAVEAHRSGIEHAVAKGRALLRHGRPALDVVTDVVAFLEADPTFDAGCGARLDRDGRAQLDAGLMDGTTLAWGAVANVRRLAHPIRVAGMLLHHDGQARLLVAEGAERFAAERGMELIDNEALITEAEQARFEQLHADHTRFHTSREFSGLEADPHGTVGCIALDQAGHLAAATSTGGASYTHPGRVGDSPLVGCGYYATAQAAASATGWGEAIAAVLLCGRTVDTVASGTSPERAAAERLQHMAASITNPQGEPATGGLITLDASGRGGVAYTTPRMARGSWAEGGAIRVAV
ncbi:MAG: hypothetical protein HKN04_13275 [Rhodothermaceae bacterium]|nr:hypothetical protein [Rhodothermaceae bacterium]